MNNSLHATYPNNFVTKSEAKADRHDDEMANKIDSSIKEMPNGVFKKNIPQVFG